MYILLFYLHEESHIDTPAHAKPVRSFGTSKIKSSHWGRRKGLIDYCTVLIKIKAHPATSTEAQKIARY